uniref:Soluble interferon alpha/beta receptor OPG204 n=1 Tax=Amphimedon queenslandica TaxID=400682 RepID=A0A1X7UYM6_AMPQE
MLPLDHSSSFSLTCTLTLAPEVNVTVVKMFWASPDLILFNSTTDGGIVLDALEPTMISVNDSVVYTLTLNFSSLQASQVGEYVCEALLNDSIVDTVFTQTSNYSVSIQVPTPLVTSSLNSTRHIFESSDIQLLCIVTITPLNVDHIVNINWFGPNGLITMNDTRHDISTEMINSNNYESSLTFKTFLSDNGTDYYCTASVGPASNVNEFELIIPSDAATSTSTTVIVENVPLPLVNITDVGVPVTGDSFQLVCTGTAPANVSSIATVSVQWVLNGTVFTNDTLEGVTVTNSGSMATLSFSSLNASTHEKNNYTCVATLSISDAPATKTERIMHNLQILTNPIVSIFSSQPVFAGQLYVLNCTVTFVAGDFDLNIMWLNGNGNKLKEQNGISFNLVNVSDTVKRYDYIFNSLSYSDIGVYTCYAILNVDIENNEPLDGNGSATVSVIIPLPQVSVSPDGNSPFIRGTVRAVSCSVVFTPPLPTNPNVSFTVFKDGDKVSFENSSRLIAVQTETTGALTFQPLNFSDAGNYTCTATVRDDANNPLIIPSSASGEYIATVQAIPVPNITFTTTTVPTPSVIVEYNATGHLVDGELVEGQFLDIMCIADISQYIDTRSSVSVTMSWRRNNTVLTNGSDFTISPPVMTNNQYTGVLRINSLRDELDNGASYNCSVSVTPGPSLIAGNDNSSAVTLTVARFDVNHVDISIKTPVPVAGNVFNLSCVIVVPPNFVEDLTSVRWTYDLAASQDVTSENNDATLVPVDRNGNIFTSVLTLDPVKTTDARQYYCQAAFIAFGTVDRTNKDLVVQISPPSVSIVADPPTGPIYESTGYLLTCTATVDTTIVNIPVTASVVWTDPSGNVIPTNEARRQVIPPTGNSLISMLLFQPIDTGHNNDGGTYTCQMTVNSGNSLIASSQTTNTTLDITVESLPPMTVDFSSVGSVEVGQSLTILCTIITIERLVVTPLITVIKMNDTDMEVISNKLYTITTDETGSVTNYALILDPVRFEDAGMYTCMAEFNVTGYNNTDDPSTATYDSQEASDVYNLTVHFPPVIVTIAKERDDTLYAGTSFFIKCDIMLDPLVTIPVTVTNQWTRDGTNVPMGSSDATITEGLNMINTLHYNATLMFYPLDNADDSGMYTCNVEVTAPNSYTYLRSTSASITVMAIPRPVVEIVAMGITEPGEEYMLNCTVTVLDRLIVSPVIIWTKRSASNVINVPPVLMNISNVLSSLYLRFSSLNTSDAGLYTCEASINISQIPIVARSNDTSKLPLKIPIPAVDVSRSRDSNFLAGSNLILTCDISVDPNVDTPFTVNVTWNMINQQIMSSGDNGDEIDPNIMMLADTNRVNISSVLIRSDFNEYRSIVNFTTLSSIEDSGTYTCIVTIVPAPVYEYVTTSDTNDMSVELNATDPMIGNFSISPDSFLGLETSCPDSYPYDNFTLTCTVTKQTIVIPNLVIAWTHNGTIETGTVTTTKNTTTTTVTNTLSFSSSTASDSGTYRCTASINSTTIMTSEERIVTIKRKLLCKYKATKPTIIIPNLVIAWTHNGTLETGTVTTTGGSMTTTVTNTLSFDSSTASDSGTYRCTASITIPDSSTITISEESTVTIRPQSLPVPATNVKVTPGTTTAAISFIIPNIAYTRETYSVKYTGAILQTTQATSIIRMSSSNISAINEEFMIMLTALEEDNTYTYTVDSTNCLGTTSTAEMSFRTLPTLPVASPIDCANITFLPRNVTLTWTAPALIDQNGVPVGYYLACMNTNGVSVNGLSPTQSSVNTMFTITDAMPFTGYTCDLSFINVVGEGPPTQCTFETAQDKPSDSPQNFTSTTNKAVVTLTWTKPAIPNGIIIKYSLNVINQNTLRTYNYTILVAVNQPTMTHSVDGFSPYQNYTASVSASTIIGAGPVATTAGRTLPDIPSSPHLVVSPVVINNLTVAYTVPVLNETTINITWSPPSHPNGKIIRFIVRIATDAITSPNNVPFEPGKTLHTLIYKGLKGKTPYYISVVAVNQVGEGNLAATLTAIVFTKTDNSVTVSPSNVQAMRVGDTIVLSWDPVTLEEAKGFFVYSIRLTPDDGSTSSTLRQTNTRTISVAYDTTSVNITDTEPQLAYTVNISILLLSDVGPIEGPVVSEIVQAPPSNSTTSASATTTTTTSTDSTSSVSVISAIVSVLVIFVTLVIMIVCVIFTIIYRKKSESHDIDVTPNAGYGMINVVNTTTENEDGVYERIRDDQVYEQLDEPDLLVARESAADTSSTIYKNTTVSVVKARLSSTTYENTTAPLVKVPTPSVIVEYNATGQLVDGELAEGQFLDIMCIADISQYIDTGVSVTLTWRRNNTVLTNGSDFTISPPVMTNNQYTGVLRINSLRDELDNGATYNCLVSVTPNTPIIIAGNDNSSAVTLTVARFDINHVDIIVPPNFVEDLTTVRWTYNLEVSQFVTSENNDATLVPVVRNGSIFTSVLTLDPVKATDARQYYCQATILVFGTVDRTNRDLTVQIFPPSVSIVADPPTGPIYESTGYLLTCTATVNTTIVDTPVTASVVWTDPSGNVIPTNETRRQVIPPTGNSLVSMLLFLPIDTGLNNDGGTYTCQMIINSGSSLLASSQATNTTLDVTVESLPPMTVDFSSDGSVE